MQSYLWMRPALQISEAVLLPALPRRSVLTEARISDRFTSLSAEPFRACAGGGNRRRTARRVEYVRASAGEHGGPGRAQGGGREHEPLQPMGPARPMPGPGRSLPMALRCRVR